MNPTLNEKFLAYLAVISGLTISVVAEYYSILGLAAIFAAAVIPVIIMGVVLGVGKITATVWLKQNWNIAPWSIRIYLSVAILLLMLITSMGIFGFLSKAHSDQNLVSGDVQSKIAIYDEKIKTARENIEANRRQLRQMDEAVDQVMGRSTDEKGADKAVAIRRAQQRDRVALAKDIEANQKQIATLNDEAAPIRAEVRKVEAEVGPIKYIAAFVYGDTDQTVLEKAVTWVIIILIVVFDPLALILLLSGQISFQYFRSIKEEHAPAYTYENTEPPTAEEKAEIEAEGDSPLGTEAVVNDQDPTVTEHHPSTHPYLDNGFSYPKGWKRTGPQVVKSEEPAKVVQDPHPVGWAFSQPITSQIQKFNADEALHAYDDERLVSKEDKKILAAGVDVVDRPGDYLVPIPPDSDPLFVQNEEQRDSHKWSEITQEEYLQAARKNKG